MQTQTITAPAAQILNIPRARLPRRPTSSASSPRCSGVVATEFSYRKDEEIYGEGEPSEYVYQVIRGAVRTYKLLSDGRRQIGAFHLAGDVFGLDPGTAHRLTAEAITDTTVRLVKRRSLGSRRGIRRQSRAQSLDHDRRRSAGTPKTTCCCSAARPRWKRLPPSCWKWIAGSRRPG